MQNGLKQYGLWVVLVLTLAATIWTSQQDDTQASSMHLYKNLDTSSDTKIAAPSLATKRLNDLNEKLAINSVNSESIQRKEISENPSNLFSTFTTTENLPVVGITEQEIVSPFVYAGKLVDEGKVTVFLIEGDKSHAVKVGNIIEELWKVKSITPPIMVLRNLSTKIEVQIEIGALS